MRRTIELVLRVVALLSLAVLLWRVLPANPRGAQRGAVVSVALADAAMDSAGTSAVRRLLPALVAPSNGSSTAQPNGWHPVHLPLPAIPAREARGALAAAADAGAGLSWTDRTAARGIAIDAASTSDPDGRVMLSAAASRGAVSLRDAGGVLDSLTLDGTNTGMLMRQTGVASSVQQGASRATVPSPIAATARRVLLFARPGWEAKFTAAALEEVGYDVDGTLAVSPRTNVTLGAPGALDTARYAVAIVIDSGVTRSPSLLRFVGQGGGVIVSGDALLDPAMAAVAPARANGVRVAVPGGLLSPQSASGLEAVRLVSHDRGVVLKREAGGAPAIVVARNGSGRTLAAAYRESWRWRMEGGTDGIDTHRAWWAGLVRAVAYVPIPPADTLVARARAGDATPYADLVAGIRAPVAMPSSVREAAVSPWAARIDAILLVVALLALLGEWAARRVRGAR